MDTALATVTLGFVSPFNAIEQHELQALIRRTGGGHQMSQRCPVWEYVIPTLGARDAHDCLVGYIQFGTGLYMTFLYGIRVDPACRGQGIARRLVAAWLQIAATVASRGALAYEAPGNTAMARLLTSAKFDPQEGKLPGLEDGGVLYAGGQESFAWAEAEPHESWH